MTASLLLRSAEQKFKENRFETPDVEARALLAGVLGCSSTQVVLRSDETFGIDVLTKFDTAVKRRLGREPVAYILGTQNFMGFEFDVSRDVLIPRPETELLVEKVLDEARSLPTPAPKILDVGTGSGCIAVSVAKLLPQAQVVAVDVSLAALKIADVNARKMGVGDRLSLLLGDLWGEFNGGCFDIIVSNPPYVAEVDLKTLEPELLFEPRVALDGGDDGLAVIERLVRTSPAYLKCNGVLVLEIGHDQARRVTALLSEMGYTDVLVFKDYGGHDRIVKGRFCGSI